MPTHAMRSLAMVAAVGAVWPECQTKDVILRGRGEYALFTDVTVHGGTAGCFIDNCETSDKFYADSAAQCGAACAKIPECQHWTYGMEDGGNKCWLRTSDAGKEENPGYIAATRQCAPPEWPACVEKDVIFRGVGQFAVFADVTPYGKTGGCFSDDCTNTDKFNSPSMDDCAFTCHKVEGCTHWTFGDDGESTKCWLRSGDGGKEAKAGSVGAVAACMPLEGFAPGAVAAAPKRLAEAPGNTGCWGGGYTFELCCAESFGDVGNPRCWDGQQFSFANCCIPPERQEL
mmetsp:Transcript_30921/g.75321  ORF Transcript_30921/g.75321 Transcript_30921/m.75321 type:complete len:287 (-) Transcript_30921:73-933(-)